MRGASCAERRASSRKPSVETSIPASGSSTCASKPAETSRSSGANRVTARSTVVERARGTRRRPCPQRSGMLTSRLALLVRAARAGIERPLVQRDEEDRVVVPDDRPACRCRGGRPSRRSPRARARARPAPSARRPRRCRRGRSPSRGRARAWWPGGRTSAKPPRRDGFDRRARGEQRGLVASSRCRACRRRATLGRRRANALDVARRVWQRSTSSSLAGPHSTYPNARAARRVARCRSGWPPVGCSVEKAGWLTSSIGDRELVEVAMPWRRPIR